MLSLHLWSYEIPCTTSGENAICQFWRNKAPTCLGFDRLIERRRSATAAAMTGRVHSWRADIRLLRMWWTGKFWPFCSIEMSFSPCSAASCGNKEERKEGTLKSAKSTNKRGSQPLTPSTFFVYIILTSIWRPTTVQGLMKEKTKADIPKSFRFEMNVFFRSNSKVY